MVPRPWEEGGWLACWWSEGPPARRSESTGWRFAPAGWRTGSGGGACSYLERWYRLAILAFFLMLTMVISNLSSRFACCQRESRPEVDLVRHALSESGSHHREDGEEDVELHLRSITAMSERSVCS